MSISSLAVAVVFGVAAVVCHGFDTTANSNTPNRISFDLLKDKRILVVGGSGRVGGSVTTQLIRHGAKVTVGGTSFPNFDRAQRRWSSLFPSHVEALKEIEFVSVNREIAATVSKVLSQAQQKYDLVVHTAGPFQGKVGVPNGVLEASINAAVPYIDVCDDYGTATAAKTKFAAAAVRNQVPCIVSTGCWPGVSSLMAKQLVTATLKKYPSLQPADLSVNFSFFTAGSGGAGVTLLVATFLILAEQALTVVQGRRRPVPAMADYTSVHFGNIVGYRSVALLNLLETASIHDLLNVGSTQSRFGTAPPFWNALLGFMARLPPSLLSNERLMHQLSVFSLPIVRLVDYFAGATNAMRCDVTTAPTAFSSTTDHDVPPQISAVYAHDNLEACVGECVVAFACAILAPRNVAVVPSGVWFAEEAVTAGTDVAAVLHLASIGAHTTDVLPATYPHNNNNYNNNGDKNHHPPGPWLTRQDVWGGSKQEGS